MKFPNNLKIEETSPYMVLIPYQWVVRNKRSHITESEAHKNGNSIFLPLPTSGLTVNDNHSWEQQTDLLYSMNKDGAMAKATSMIKGMGEKVVGDQVANYAAYQRGRLTNTYDSLLYSGVELREFNFTWTLIPQSKADSEALKEIVKHIRTRSMPSIASIAEYTYPDFWQIAINFGSGLYNSLNIRDCVATSVSVDYSPDGPTRVLRGGEPLQIQLNITFKELQRNSRKDVQ